MKCLYPILISLLATFYFVSKVQGQAIDQSAAANNPYLTYNPNSVNPIPEPHILFRRRIWREIYLQEKQNKPLFARNKEITKLIIEGVEQGSLTPYKDESLTEKMTQAQFFENLSLPGEGISSDDVKTLEFTDDAAWGGDYASSASDAHREQHFLPNEITTLELMEDIIFDKVQAKLIHDIQTIKLIIPADKLPTKICKVVGTFKYKDLYNYFNNKPKEAVWVNVANNAGNIKLTEAFELRLFSARIVKRENPEDANIEDIYNKTPEEALYASHKFEEELIELEHFLWEH